MTQSGNLTNPDKISSKGQNQKNSLLQKEIQIEGEKERHKFLCCLFVEKLKKETVNTLQQSVHNLISNIKQKLHD